MPLSCPAAARHSKRKPAVPVLVPASELDVTAAYREAPASVLQRSTNHAEARRAMIAAAAYYRAEKRGFVAGGELGDRLRAEARIDSLPRL